MRCQAAGARAGDVVDEVAGGRRRAVFHDDGRLFIGVAQHHAERSELTQLRGLDARADFPAQLLALAGLVLQAVGSELLAQDRVIRFGLGHDPFMHRAALGLIAVQQRAAAPTLQPRRQLPAQVDPVGDPHVHPIAAEGRMQVAGVPRQEYSAQAVLVGDEPTCDPFVATQYLVRKVQASGAPDHRRRVDVGELHTGPHPRRHEEPGIASVHRPDKAGQVVVDLPVHDRRSMAVSLRQARRTEDDVVVAREAVLPLHSRADELAHHAARAIRPHDVVGANTEGCRTFLVE